MTALMPGENPMLEILHLEFMRNALIAGLLAAVTCGMIGTLVVVNRIVFLAGGIAHAAYGGIGLAFFLGWPPLAGTLAAAVASALIMGGITLRDRHRSDAVIGVIWATGMAVGVILLDLTPGYQADLMSYLFGSILTVPASDLRLMALMAAGIFLILVLCHDGLLAVSYDPEFARLRGLSAGALHCLLLIMVAVAVIMVIRVVGLILVIALLTIPPYIAERRSRSLAGMMAASALLCALFTLAGLWLSYAFNLTSGASIILVAAAAFFLTAASRALQRNGWRRNGGTAPDRRNSP